MHLKLGLLIVGAVVGGVFWSSPRAVEVKVVDRPIVVNDQVKISVREDAVPSVLRAFHIVAATGDKRDPFVGTWIGDCGDLVQCALEIKFVDQAYRMELKVSDWQNVDDVVCRLTGNMDRSADGKLLAGKMGSSPLSGVFLRGSGALELHDFPDEDCANPYTLDGIYRILGD